MGQAVLNRRDDVGIVIVIAKVVERGEPALLAPDRRLVRADRDDVELAAFGRDVGRGALAQHVFLEHYPVQLMTGGLLPLGRQLLHDDHVGVVDRGDGQRLSLYSKGPTKLRHAKCRNKQSGRTHSRHVMDPPKAVDSWPSYWHRQRVYLGGFRRTGGKGLF